MQRIEKTNEGLFHLVGILGGHFSQVLVVPIQSTQSFQSSHWFFCPFKLQSYPLLSLFFFFVFLDHSLGFEVADDPRLSATENKSPYIKSP